jgi:hypothetical protein
MSFMSIAKPLMVKTQAKNSVLAKFDERRNSLELDQWQVATDCYVSSPGL